MASIKSGLLEKADFGKFQKENQEALGTLDKDKRNLRVKRKLKEAKTREKQVKVKFNNEGSEYRDALIKIGNKPHPARMTFLYDTWPKNPKIDVKGFYDTNPNATEAPVNKMFKPSHLKTALNIIKKRYPKAESIMGARVSGVRAKVGTDLMQKISLRGKKLGLLGLGLSLKEAIQAGKAAYDAKEGKL